MVIFHIFELWKFFDPPVHIFDRMTLVEEYNIER